MFSASNTTQFGATNPASPFTSAVPRYEFGVSGEFRLPNHLRFEVDGLFKRGGFNSSGPFGSGGGLAYKPTTLNQWEIPGLFKYNISLGHFGPLSTSELRSAHLHDLANYVRAGPTLAHTS